MRHGVRVVPATVAGAALAALAALYVIDPNSTYVPLCPLHALTGLWCPFCGATRATHALLHGDLGTALHDNALLVCAIPPVVLLGWHRVRDGQPIHHPLPGAARWALFGMAVVFTVLRNLPAGWWLAPPA